MFLLDTVVLSELRKRGRARSAHVVAWLRSVEDDALYLSVVTIAEIERGIGRQRKADPRFAAELEAWLDIVLRAYGERILPLSVPIARRWGELAARLGHAGLDLAIAATALEHGLAVATRNIADFAPTGVAVVNPFEKAG